MGVVSLLTTHAAGKQAKAAYFEPKDMKICENRRITNEL